MISRETVKSEVWIVFILQGLRRPARVPDPTQCTFKSSKLLQFNISWQMEIVIFIRDYKNYYNKNRIVYQEL